MAIDDFGTRLRQARRAQGLSQEAASEGIVTASFLSLIEAGKRTPSPHVAAALAARLGLETLASSDPAFTGALAAVRAGDLEQARIRAARLPAGSAARLFIDGLCDERQGLLQSATSQLRAAEVGVNDDRVLRLEIAAALARVAYNVGDMALAAATAEAALTEMQSSSIREADLVMEIRATLSGVYCDTGNLERARELVDDVEAGSTPWQMGTRLWAQSVLAVVEGDPERADRLAAEALEAFRAAERPLSVARLQVNAALLRLHLHGPAAETVLELLQAAESTFRGLSSAFDLAGCLVARGRLAAVRGERATARECIEEALLLVQHEGAGLRARIYASAAVTWLELGDDALAEQHLLEARALLESAGASRAVATTWRQLAAAYESMGQLDAALACMKAATDLLGVPANLVPQPQLTAAAAHATAAPPRQG